MKTDEELAEELKDLMVNDGEINHLDADEFLTEVLIELGYVKLAEAYREESKFFWYA